MPRARRFAITIALLALAVPPQGAAGEIAADPLTAALADVVRSTGGRVDVRIETATGVPSFVRALPRAHLAQSDAALPAEDRARAFLAEHGDLIGMTAAQRAASRSTLQVREVATDPAGRIHVSFEQLHGGLPVFGTRLNVHLDDQGVTAINGTFVPWISVATTPAVGEQLARAAAVDALASEHDGVHAEEAALQIFHRGLIEGTRGETSLAWAVVVAGDGVREQVWIDAADGTLLARYPLQHAAKDRCVYTPRYDPDNPELFVAKREGDPSFGTGPVDNLYDFSGQVYDFFNDAFGFDSYDNSGIKMRTVYLINEVCPNAYWNGRATYYCPGFDTDDVVAHEWGHAYTDFTHDLVYAYQPGALNESYSDIWGETIDLLNGRDALGGSNNDEPFPAGQRWLVGEDTTLHDRVHRAIGLRDMWNPERLGAPGRVLGGGYVCGTGDNGGVHTNSSVPNHAYAMLVDGKAYNGHTIEGLGLTKAAHVYWQAQRYYQGPATKFPEHDQALQASCADLLGVDLGSLIGGAPSGEVLTTQDCAQVAEATAAVELSETTRCVFFPILLPGAPPVCDGAETLFSDDFDSGLDGWTLESEGEFMAWPGWNWEARGALPGGRPGSAAFAVDASAGSCDAYVVDDVTGRFSMATPVLTAPSDTSGLLLRFDHFVNTQRSFDGGNVQISIDGGEYVVVSNQAFVHNPPRERLTEVAVVAVNLNPKAGEYAWHGYDAGDVTGSWGTSVVDLDRLVDPGQTYSLRWDFGVDSCAGRQGWFVDDVAVYRCVSTEE